MVTWLVTEMVQWDKVREYKNGKTEFHKEGVVIVTTPESNNAALKVEIYDKSRNYSHRRYYSKKCEGYDPKLPDNIKLPPDEFSILIPRSEWDSTEYKGFMKPITLEQKIKTAETEYERYQMSKRSSLLKKADFAYGLKTKGMHASLLTKRADIEDDEHACSSCGGDTEGDYLVCPSCGKEPLPSAAASYDRRIEKEFHGGKQADVPENLQEIRKPVSKEYDAIKWIYNWYVANELETLPWRILQKNFQQFTQKYNTLFTEIRHNKPDVTQADLKAWLDAADAAQEAGRYKVDYERYNDPKTSFRDVEQLVVQLNQSADAKRIIGQDPVFKEYIKMVSQGGGQSGHPVAETTVGWIRLDFINDEWLLVDEVQSDLVNSVTQAKSIVMEPSYESFFEHLTNPHVRELVQEKVTPEMFDGLKHHFNQKGYTPEKLDEIKDKLVELFQDWAEYGISSILEIARKHGIKNVAIHTAETIARRDESVEADKVKMYYDNLVRSFGFRKQQLDAGDLKGNFWVRTASALTDKKKNRLLMQKFKKGTEVVYGRTYSSVGANAHMIKTLRDAGPMLVEEGVVVAEPVVDGVGHVLVQVQWNDDNQVSWFYATSLFTKDEVDSPQPEQQKMMFSSKTAAIPQVLYYGSRDGNPPMPSGRHIQGVYWDTNREDAVNNIPVDHTTGKLRSGSKVYTATIKPGKKVVDASGNFDDDDWHVIPPKELQFIKDEADKSGVNLNCGNYALDNPNSPLTWEAFFDPLEGIAGCIPKNFLEKVLDTLGYSGISFYDEQHGNYDISPTVVIWDKSAVNVQEEEEEQQQMSLLGAVEDNFPRLMKKWEKFSNGRAGSTRASDMSDEQVRQIKFFIDVLSGELKKRLGQPYLVNLVSSSIYDMLLKTAGESLVEAKDNFSSKHYGLCMRNISYIFRRLGSLYHTAAKRENLPPFIQQVMKMFRPGSKVIGAFEDSKDGWDNPDHYRTGIVVKQPKIENRTDTSERILVAVHWDDTPKGEYVWKSSVVLSTADEVVKAQQKELKFSGDKKPQKMLVDKPEVYAEARSDPRQVSLYGKGHEQELQDMYAKPSMKTVKSMLLKDCVEE